MSYANKEIYNSNARLDRMWDILENELGVSEEVLQVVTDINGYNEETMCDILFCTHGYRDFEQLEDGEGISF